VARHDHRFPGLGTPAEPALRGGSAPYRRGTQDAGCILLRRLTVDSGRAVIGRALIGIPQPLRIELMVQRSERHRRIPGFCAARLAIAPVSLTRFQASMRPRCSQSDSVIRCPASLDWVRASRVPRRHQYYQSTTTSCAEYGVAYVFRIPAPTDPLLVRSLAAGEIRRAWARSSPVPLATFGWSYAGAHSFLGNPSHTSAPLYDSGRSGRPHPGGLPGTVPGNPTTRTPRMLISELNHAASVSAAYASSRALPHAHARLASGWWLAFAGRASVGIEVRRQPAGSRVTGIGALPQQPARVVGAMRGELSR